MDRGPIAHHILLAASVVAFVVALAIAANWIVEPAKSADVLMWIAVGLGAFAASALVL